MAEYKNGDLVEATRDIPVSGKVIPTGTPGIVTADTSPDVISVRVKFAGDPGVNFRVVLKSAVKRRT